MESYTVSSFWKERFADAEAREIKLVRGWHSKVAGLSSFLEAPLTRNCELTDVAVPYAKLFLISAPGAVGKSTLARQIASETGAVLVDLAEAEPVGGNTISGGLAKSGLYGSWEQGRTALLIDGLDEARLRLRTQSACG